ncbi:hypothetical protein Sste5344_009885 [Sporothrix stenoceras]
MASTDTAAKPLSEAGLSDKDLKNIAAAWLSCPAGDNASPLSAHIDMEKFTVLAGYSTVVNARKRFGEVKKRVRTLVFGPDNGKGNDNKDESGDNPGDSPTATPKITPKKAPAKTATKRKAAGTARNGSPPAKKGKTAKKEQAEESGANAAAQDSSSVKDEDVKEGNTKEDYGDVKA